MKFLILNGPNMNMLGIREKEIYGVETYQELLRRVSQKCEDLNIKVECYQSNYEGALVEKIQDAYFQKIDAIVINPAALTHTSVALLDALKAVNIPAVEVHISDTKSREVFRHISYTALYCEKTIQGKGISGYEEAIEYLYEKLKDK